MRHPKQLDMFIPWIDRSKRPKYTVHYFAQRHEFASHAEMSAFIKLISLQPLFTPNPHKPWLWGHHPPKKTVTQHIEMKEFDWRTADLDYF